MVKRFKSIDLGLIIIITFGLFINVASANALPIQNTNIYLPIIVREPPPPLLFPNGDFEQGPAVWTEISGHGYPLITNEVNITPYDGTWVVWLGGVSDDISYIEQQVNVPVNLHYLSYWHWIWSDSCGYDFGHVRVNSNEILTYDLCQSDNTNGWVQVVINLSVYAGQSVMIQIGSECNHWPI